MVRWVIEKETRKSGDELVRIRGGDVGIAKTAKDMNNGIVKGDTIEGFIRSVIAKSRGREEVKDKRSDFEGLGRERRRKMGLEEKRANFVGESTNETVSVPILLRGIWASVARRDAGMREEGIERVVLKLTTIVALKSFNFSIKIILNKSIERDNSFRNIIFVFESICPSNVCEIIK